MSEVGFVTVSLAGENDLVAGIQQIEGVSLQGIQPPLSVIKLKVEAESYADIYPKVRRIREIAGVVKTETEIPEDTSEV